MYLPALKEAATDRTLVGVSGSVGVPCPNQAAWNVVHVVQRDWTLRRALAAVMSRKSSARAAWRLSGVAAACKANCLDVVDVDGVAGRSVLCFLAVDPGVAGAT